VRYGICSEKELHALQHLILRNSDILMVLNVHPLPFYFSLLFEYNEYLCNAFMLTQSQLHNEYLCNAFMLTQSQLRLQ